MSTTASAPKGTSSPWMTNIAPAAVVTLISIPLSMGIAIASGVPPARGLVTAIVGGLVIGSLAGSPRQISGPSAGLAVMVLDVVNRHGLVALGVVVPLMGLLQAGAGLLKLGQLFRAVSPAVINGMLAGIGVLIFAAQFHVMLDGSPKGSGLENFTSIPAALVEGVTVHPQAAGIGLLTLMVLVGMSFLKGRLAKVPPALAAVLIATAVTVALGFTIQRVEMPARFIDALAFPQLSDFAMLLQKPSLLVSGVALAFVASAETLLCSSAVDGMHDGDRTDYDRELFAQGIGNMVCGFLGAPPTTGVITRSTANVNAGGTGRQSAIMVGAALLAFVAAFSNLLEIIPRACLAAILVYIGYKLVRKRPYAELRRFGRSELFIYVVTVAVIVGVNLLTGIVLGLVLSLIKLAYSYGRGFHRFDIDVRHDADHKQTHVHLRGAASFIRLPRLAGTLEALPRDEEIHLHIEELDYIDHACIDIITKWERQRISGRAPVRIEWDYLHHKYHANNPLDQTPEEHAEEPDRRHFLLEFLTPELIFIDPEFSDKQDAIRTMGAHLVRTRGLEVDGDAFIGSALRREADNSTCIGEGLMVPHGVLKSRQALMGMMALSSKGWNFDAPDDKPVKCIVLLATPQDSAAHHLAVLAAFARLFSRKPALRDQLLGVSTGEEAIALLQSEEAVEINYGFDRVVSSRNVALKSD